MPKGSRKDKKWQKIREQKAREREAKPKEVFRKYVPDVNAAPLPRAPSRHVMTDGMLKAASLPSNMTITGRVPSRPALQRLSPEMEERERLAQEETKRKSKMVAPICNKGGYVYVGDSPPEIVQTLGRKV